MENRRRRADASPRGVAAVAVLLLAGECQQHFHFLGRGQARRSSPKSVFDALRPVVADFFEHHFGKGAGCFDIGGVVHQRQRLKRRIGAGAARGAFFAVGGVEGTGLLPRWVRTQGSTSLHPWAMIRHRFAAQGPQRAAHGLSVKSVDASPLFSPPDARSI